MERFAAAVLESCNLKLQVSKTKVYLKSVEKPPEAPANMPRAGEMVGGQWEAGFMCYGIAIGTKRYVQSRLQGKVEKLSGDIDQVMDLLQQDSQAAWTLLSCSLSSQLD